MLPSLFKWRHFLPEIILLNVRWYCRYPLSYRDLEEMVAERGINRWIIQQGLRRIAACPQIVFATQPRDLPKLGMGPLGRDS